MKFIYCKKEVIMHKSNIIFIKECFGSPQRLNDFRPISLVGSMYKILAKVLANRLRSMIDYVVSDTQSAFIKCRLILDGIFVANEIVDEGHRCKKELILFKVDFEKAFHSIDWGI